MFIESETDSELAAGTLRREILALNTDALKPCLLNSPKGNTLLY